MARGLRRWSSPNSSTARDPVSHRPTAGKDQNRYMERPVRDSPSSQFPWPRSLTGEDVTRVRQLAQVKRQAPAANAAAQVVAKPLQAADLVVELGPPRLRQALPVPAGGRAPVRELVERGPDAGERNPDTLRGADERHPAQHLARVAALVAGG